MAALKLIRERVEQCEAEGVALLCCPEAILGGLADYGGCALIRDRLETLANSSVTTIVGFSERVGDRLYNSAAVLHRGVVAGVYRKRHPAIRHSVYFAGSDTPVFHLDGLTFGIVICNDSNDPTLAAAVVAQGASVLSVPTNNGLPADRDHAAIAESARHVDVATAIANRLWVIRADVVGTAAGLISHGSSAIIAPDGRIVATANGEGLIVADVG